MDKVLKFHECKESFDDKNKCALSLECFLPVHLTSNKKETNLWKKNEDWNEQYYK